MTVILHLEQIGFEDRARTGGKAFALAAMRGQGLNVPQALCICTEAYHAYVDSTHLRDRIFMEIHRKAYALDLPDIARSSYRLRDNDDI